MCSIVISHRSHSISVDFSLVGQFHNFIGGIYEVYGSIEESPPNSNNMICCALLINMLHDADLAIIEQSIYTFNSIIHSDIDCFKI